MKKHLIAAAVGSLCAVSAYAQSNVTIYGRVDMGYQTFTNDGKATLEDQESANRWGLMGEETLGGGLKAFFQLENRFYLDNGNQETNRQWKEMAFVGLAHDKLGAVSFGRTASAAYSLYSGGTYEAFGGDTIGAMPSRRGKIQNIWDNSTKYESPMFAGMFKVIGTLGLGEHNAANDRTRWGAGGQFAYGAFRLDGAYQKDTINDNAIAGSSGSGAVLPTTATSMGDAYPWKTWLVSAAYDFKVVQFMGGYSQSKGYKAHAFDNRDAKFTVYQIGLRVPIGAGQILANAGRSKERTADGEDLKALNHFGLGYWYNLSKRTILMANLSYERQKGGFTDVNNAEGKDNRFGTELAIRHTF